MSLQGTIKRYSLLIENIQRNTYPSGEMLLNYLHDNGFEISERSMQRDIAAIRNEFGIDIQYSKSKNGYFIDRENSINFESFLSFMEIVNTSDLLMESIRDGKNALNYISFESAGNLKGVGYLKQLLEAIKMRKYISFQHFNFHTEKHKNYVIEPYLLKQYQSRWYIIGMPKGLKELRCFGIDRIELLEVLNTKYKIDKSIDAYDLFSQVVGLSISDGRREIVKIAVKYPQANYVKTLPLHTSQEIEQDTEDRIIISLFVIPNFELIQKIMMHVEHAKVLEPKWLADEIKSHLKWMSKNYS